MALSSVYLACVYVIWGVNLDLTLCSNLRGSGGGIIRRVRIEKGGGHSLGGVASRSAARSAGIGIDRKRMDLGFGRRQRRLVWRWAGGNLVRVGTLLSRS